jgi:nitroreductase
MNVSDAIRTRKSVRKFLDKPVEKEKLLEVLEAGRLAPSASNRQEWRYVVVTDKGMREKLAEAASNQSFVGQAPVVIVCLAETDQHRMACGEVCYPVDCAISMDHMTLRATELGLGTCWIGAVSAPKVRELLGIPSAMPLIDLLPLGYPADPKPVAKSRKPISETVHFEKW